MHAALRDILGPHVKQHGSLVAPNRLRFDFSHFKGLTSANVEDIENLVNDQIRENTRVQTEEMGMQDALERGALAFFGDKYGDQVRVVEIGSFSKELCGGTHCHQTGEVGLFRIATEGGVAAGVRRIEALTGDRAIQDAQQREADWREVAALLKVSTGDVVDRTKKLLSTMRETERELERAKQQLLDHQGASQEATIQEVTGIPVLVQQLEGLTMQELRTFSDKLRKKVSDGVLVLGSSKDQKVSLLVIVGKEQAKRMPAGKIAQHIAQFVGGSGGGRPDMAQAGGNQPEHLEKALQQVIPFVESQLAS